MADIDGNGKGGKRPLAVMAVDTSILLKRMVQLKIGEQLTYDDLTALIGRDVRDAAYGNMQSARRAALRDGIVIGTIQKVGIKRLNDEEIVKTGRSVMRHIHRASRKATRIITCVKDFDALPKQVQIEHNAALSQLSVLSHITSIHSAKKLEDKVAELGGSLPLARTLKELS